MDPSLLIIRVDGSAWPGITFWCADEGCPHAPEQEHIYSTDDGTITPADLLSAAEAHLRPRAAGPPAAP